MMTSVGLPRRYAHVGVCFALGGVALLIGVGVYVFGAAEVLISLRQPEVSTTMVANIQRDPSLKDLAVPGVVMEVMVSDSASGPTTGLRQSQSDTLGSVTLTNQTPRSQVLVATTRLLASDGTLLRLKDRVNVPAQGTITAAVYADKPEEFRELAPTKFTIPGLAESLQSEIFASTQQPLKPGGLISVVQTADIDALEKTLTDQLAQKALLEINQQLTPEQSLYTKLVESEVVDRQPDARPGDERTSVTLTLNMRVAVIAFDEARMLALVSKQLSQTLPPGQRLAGLGVENVAYKVQAYDPVTNFATVTVNAKSAVGLAEDSPWLNSGALVGMTAPQIKQYYAPLGSNATVDVRLIPSWLPTAPRVANRIKIVIK